jgi:hypothetical protein
MTRWRNGNREIVGKCRTRQGSGVEVTGADEDHPIEDHCKIPEEAWERFWTLVDEYRKDLGV